MTGFHFKDVQQYRHSITAEDVKTMNTVSFRSDSSWNYADDHDYQMNLKSICEFAVSEVIPQLFSFSDRKYALEKFVSEFPEVKHVLGISYG